MKYNFPPNIEFRKSSFPTPFSRRGSSLNPFWYNLYLPLQLRHHQLDTFFAPNFVLPSSFKGKCVLTVHDIGPIVNPELFPKRYVLYFRRMVKRAAQRADKIVTVSQSTNKDLMNWIGLDHERIEVVYHGRDEKFKEINNQALIARTLHRYRMPSEYILYVGDLSERKNLNTLIVAYGKLKREYRIRQELVLVGKPKFAYAKIFNLIRELDLEKQVSIVSNVSNEHLPVIYSGARVFVSPSLFEGFGLPLLEAMACGTPLVASNSTSIPEVVGDAGILADGTDSDEVASAIFRLLKDNSVREELKGKGLERAKQFSWKKAAEETLNILERVALQRP